MSSGQDYYGNYGGLSVAEYVERHVRGSNLEMARMRRTVALLPPSVQTVLDIGAGHGTLLEELRSARGIQGVGIEITPAKVDYARSRGIDLRLGDAARLDFPDGAFDAVLLCEVLEHLPYGAYEAALRECARVARQWVVITVPFNERRRFVKCPYCGSRVNPDYHFRTFSQGSLASLVPGFDLEQSLPLGARPASMLIDAGRKWISRWPQFLACPACGYRPPLPTAPADTVPTAEAVDWLGRARRIAGRITLRSRPIWLVGLFRRR